MDITAKKEIRWTGEGIIDKTNCIIFYRCDKKHHAFGTGFIVSKWIKQLVTNLKVKTLRLRKIRLRGLFFNYSVICMHVPTEEKDNFYEDLDHISEDYAERDIKILIWESKCKNRSRRDVQADY
jgi:predicted Zn-ribbon and HTH transcriptional regulator